VGELREALQAFPPLDFGRILYPFGRESWLLASGDVPCGQGLARKDRETGG
jgi:hypothetical protein